MVLNIEFLYRSFPKDIQKDRRPGSATYYAPDKHIPN